MKQNFNDSQFRTIIIIDYLKSELVYYNEGSFQDLENFANKLTIKEKKQFMNEINNAISPVKDVFVTRIKIKEVAGEPSTPRINWKARALRAEAMVERLEKRLDALERENAQLRAENAALKLKVHALEIKISELEARLELK